jgi:nicotinate-nucleotide--dimethylbenzimidazole phosphoribosyltransferase
MPFIPGKFTHPHLNYTLPYLSDILGEEIQSKLDHKTKPLGSLGELEILAKKISLIQNTLEPEILNPILMIFAGDHGIALERVSAYPQEVTYQMVLNFLNGGAAANVLARQGKIALEIIDAGVNHDFRKVPGLHHLKIARSTRNFLREPAMAELELLECFIRGKGLAISAREKGSNLLAFGEMGIGNTSASSLLTHVLTGISLENCIGSGTGMHSSALLHKKEILIRSLERFHKEFPNPDLYDVLRNFGGYEILMMCGTMLQAASLGISLVIDGFISTSAWICAYYLKPEILDFTFFSHLSGEKGHKYQLEFIGVKPLLELNLRLGEGTGALLAIPIIQSSVKILNEMASFDSAGVSQKES